MTKAEAIKRMCRLQGAVHAHLGYATASDCFCEDADMPGPYRNDGEVIAFIEDWELGFNDGNAVKYIARCDHKGKALEDLKKALWYLRRHVESERSVHHSLRKMPNIRVLDACEAWKLTDKLCGVLDFICTAKMQCDREPDSFLGNAILLLEDEILRREQESDGS